MLKWQRYLLMFAGICSAAAAAGVAEPDGAVELLRELRWQVVNDNVMGGRSKGGYQIEGDVLHFSGATNTNGGGFASIRSVSRNLELPNGGVLRIRLRGDGRTYTLRLAGSDRRIGYWATFTTQADGWQVIEMSADAFRPFWRGRRLNGGPLPFDEVRSVGFMINDGLDGSFQLRVADLSWIPDAP